MTQNSEILNALPGGTSVEVEKQQLLFINKQLLSMNYICEEQLTRQNISNDNSVSGDYNVESTHSLQYQQKNIAEIRQSEVFLLPGSGNLEVQEKKWDNQLGDDESSGPSIKEKKADMTFSKNTASFGTQQEINTISFGDIVRSEIQPNDTVKQDSMNLR